MTPRARPPAGCARAPPAGPARPPPSGCEALDHPDLVDTPVAKAVVQTVLAVLPELVQVGRDEEAAPAGRPGDGFARVSRAQPGGGLLELLTTGNDLTLL